MGATIARAVAALVLQGGLAAWLTWPLARHLGTLRPASPWPISEYDWPLLASALAHEATALVTDPGALLHGKTFHPDPYAILYGEAAYGALPYFLPTYLLTGNPTLALNLIFLGGVIATATTLHLVAERWTSSWTAGAVAGWMFLTTPWVLWSWVPTAPNYALLYTLPLIALVAAERCAGAAGAATLASLLILQGAVTPYLAAAALLPVGVLAALRLARARTRRTGAWMGLAIVVSVASLLALYWGNLTLHAADPGIQARTAWVRETRLPTIPLPAGLVDHRHAFGVRPPAYAMLCIGVLVVTVRLLRRRALVAARAWRHGSLWLGVGLLAAIHRIDWHGADLTLPHAALLHSLPGLAALRVPTRLGVIALVGLGILVAAAFAEATQPSPSHAGAGRRARRGRAATRLALAVVAVWALHASYASLAGPNLPGGRAEYLVMKAPAPLPEPIAAALRRTPGPLLEVPVSMLRVTTGAMVRQIEHGHPIVNGYNGYFPPDFPRRMELACRLPDVDALQALRSETGLALVLVHARPGMWSGAAPQWPYNCADLSADDRAARRQGWEEAAQGRHPHLRLLARGGGLELFRVTVPEERQGSGG